MKKILIFIIAFVPFKSALSHEQYYHHTHQSNPLDMMTKGMEQIGKGLDGPARRAEAERQRQHELEMARIQSQARIENQRQAEKQRQYESDVILAEKRNAAMAAQQRKNELARNNEIRKTQQSKPKTWENSSYVFDEQGYHVIATISVSPINQVFTVGQDNKCTAQEDTVHNASPMYVNDVLVKFSTACYANGSKAYFATTIEGSEYILNQFKNKNSVTYQSNNKKSSMTFSAKGFSKTFEVFLLNNKGL